MPDPGQLSLFAAPRAPPAALVGPAEPDPGDVALGARLPPLLRFGTSSWGYPGWSGLVYDRPAPEALIAKSGLHAYSQHPLLRCVGVDRTHYRPVEAAVFADYAAQVPERFRFLAKAHDHCTLARFPAHPRYGELKGKENPRFFDPDYAAEAVVGPFAEGLGPKAGPLLFQLAPQPLEWLHGRWGFADRVYDFLSRLPKTSFYALEVRNADLVTDALGRALLAARAAPCLLAYPGMPDVEEQARVLHVDRAPALVLRWMLGPDLDHESAGALYSPFDRLQDPDAVTRAAVARLCVGALRRGRPALVIVNNNAEGCAPRSIGLLAREVDALLGGRAGAAVRGSL